MKDIAFEGLILCRNTANRCFLPLDSIFKIRVFTYFHDSTEDRYYLQGIGSYGSTFDRFFWLLTGRQTWGKLLPAKRLSCNLYEFSWIWQLSNTVISFIISAALFAMIYKYLPDVRIGWSDVIIGAAITAGMFSVGKFLIGLYLGRTAIGSTCGAAGSFVVLLVWIYYSALICFLGAEITQVYARRYGSRIRPEPHAVRIDSDAP